MTSFNNDYDLSLSGQKRFVHLERPMLRPDEQVFPIGGNAHVVFRSNHGTRYLGAYESALDAVTVAKVAAAAALKGDVSYDAWENAFISGQASAEDVIYRPAPDADVKVKYDEEGKYNLFIREKDNWTIILSTISYSRIRRAITDIERHKTSGDFDAWSEKMTYAASAARERQYKRLLKYAEALGPADKKKGAAPAKKKQKAITKKEEKLRERERLKSIRAAKTAKVPYDWIFYINGAFTVKAFWGNASYKLGSYVSCEDAVGVSTAAHGAASDGNMATWAKEFRKRTVRAGKVHFVSEPESSAIDGLEVDTQGRYCVFAMIGGQKTRIASFKSFLRAKKLYLSTIAHEEAGDLESWAASFIEKESVRIRREAESRAKAAEREKRVPKGYYRNGRGAYFVQMKYKDRSYYVGCYYDEATAVRIAQQARSHIIAGDFEEWLPGIREMSGKRGRFFRTPT